MGSSFGKLPPEHSAWGSPPPQDEAHRTRPADTLLPDEQPLAGPGEEPGTQPFAIHSPSPSAKTIVLTVAFAILGFVTCAAILHAWIACIRDPLYLHADIRSGKLQIMEEWQDRAHSASFGSSHVHNGFDPRSFDRALAGTPLQTRTINLGVAGGSQTEQRVMALEFLRHLRRPSSASPQSCVLLLELTAGANFAPDHLIHPRSIDIYDMATTRFANQLTSTNMNLARKTTRLGIADFEMLLHYTNVGMLSNSLLPNLEADSQYEAETEADRRGVLNMQPSPLATKILASVIAKAPKHPVMVPGEMFPGNILLIQQLESAAPFPGVLFAYVVFPKLWDLEEEKVYPDSIHVNGTSVPVIDLARPDRFPELYRADYWFDDSHFDQAGAEAASAVLADQLKTFYAAHPGRLTCGG